MTETDNAGVKPTVTGAAATTTETGEVGKDGGGNNGESKETPQVDANQNNNQAAKDLDVQKSNNATNSIINQKADVVKDST